MRLAAAISLVLACVASAAAAVELHAPPIEPGSAPVVRITGLEEGQPVRLWTVRHFTKWQEVQGKWVEVPVKLYAWASSSS